MSETPQIPTRQVTVPEEVGDRVRILVRGVLHVFEVVEGAIEVAETDLEDVLRHISGAAAVAAPPPAQPAGTTPTSAPAPAISGSQPEPEE